MNAPRYICPLYGTWIILLIVFIKRIAAYINNGGLRCIAGICFISLMLGQSWKTYPWPELYTEAGDAVAMAREYGEHNECIYIYKGLWRSLPSYQEFRQYQKITFIPEDSFGLLLQEHYTSQHNVVIYFDRTITPEEVAAKLKSIIETSPNILEYQRLYEYSYNVAYYLE